MENTLLKFTPSSHIFYILELLKSKFMWCLCGIIRSTWDLLTLQNISSEKYAYHCKSAFYSQKGILYGDHTIFETYPITQINHSCMFPCFLNMWFTDDFVCLRILKLIFLEIISILRKNSLFTLSPKQ